MGFTCDVFRITLITKLYFINFSSSSELSHKFNETDLFLNQQENTTHVPNDINDFADRYGLRRFLFKGNKVHFKVPEDAKLSFSALTKKYGHPSEEHRIVSKDGYITKFIHLPGDKTRPVLMMHGIFDSCDTFVIRGNRSMAIALANAGYDVWLGNMRGNKYSRKHKHMNPDKDREYWNFSFHEMALYDLPATIDYILNHTGQKQIAAIAHSQGNCIFLAMASMLPQYNEKIKLLISLAPAVYLQNIKKPIKRLAMFSPLINHLFLRNEYEEILPNGDIAQKLLHKVCPAGLAGYLLCAELFLFLLVGFNPDELEREFLSVILGHAPSGSSRRNFYHLAQATNNKCFAQYDFGLIKNLEFYGSMEPPLYDLSAVTMKVAIFGGKNDKLVVVKDIERLNDELSNVVQFTVLEEEKINHIDFVWARNADTILFPYIFELLQ